LLREYQDEIGNNIVETLHTLYTCDDNILSQALLKIHEIKQYSYFIMYDLKEWMKFDCIPDSDSEELSVNDEEDSE